MNRWLLKTDPETYSFTDLQRERETVWDGVKNPQALQSIRLMAKGDWALIYHSGDDKCIVGLAEIAGAPFADPKAKDEKLVVVPIMFKKRLTKSIPLSAIKADTMFKDFLLVRNSRLSVMPVSESQWQRLLSL